jgi:hypothetical protein
MAEQWVYAIHRKILVRTVLYAKQVLNLPNPVGQGIGVTADFEESSRTILRFLLGPEGHRNEHYTQKRTTQLESH